ncbi:RNase H domain-containing protein [Trichonephila clavipes]|nr:RNase H domain-containing protein [Trichonephila clavipes]
MGSEDLGEECAELSVVANAAIVHKANAYGVLRGIERAQTNKFLSEKSLLENDVAEDLAKAATRNPVDPADNMVLTWTEIYSRARELICRTWVVPPVHTWYSQRHPGSAISFKGSKSYQTAFSRFLTGHLRCINFEGGKRNFPICLKCNISPFYPQHILQCLGVSCEEDVASLCCS